MSSESINSFPQLEQPHHPLQSLPQNLHKSFKPRLSSSSLLQCTICPFAQCPCPLTDQEYGKITSIPIAIKLV